MKESHTMQDKAFGIVPLSQQNNGYQFLLIQHHAGHWGFPKGHADPGESPIEAACREFTEETGIVAYELLSDASFSERYFFKQNGQLIRKTVIYYMALAQSTAVQCQAAEIQAYAWLNFDAAIARLSFDNTKQILRDVYRYLNNGAGET
jgi:8-oxo-dGTP pyrophosphatase MutT (NUDIX family)